MNDLNTQLLKLISLAGRAHCNVQHLEQLAINAAALRDWQSLADVTEHQGMIPLFYSHCLTAGVAIPVEVRRQLQVLTLRQRAGNQTRAKALVEILFICKTEGIEVLILKDAALAWTVYPSPGLRPIHNLELLTLPSQVKRLEEILLSCGYRLPDGEDGATVSSHRHKGLWRMQDGLRIKVVTHTALMIKNQITGERNISTVIERGKAFMLDDIKALSPHPMDMLGQAYQDLINAPMKVIHCSDLISVAEQFTDEIDWDQVQKNHPGIFATLELLHCMNPLEEHLFQVANLSVSSRVIHFGENFFKALLAIEPNMGMSGNTINFREGDQALRYNLPTHEHRKQNEDGQLTGQSFQAVWDSLRTRHHAFSEQPQMKKALDTLVTLEPQWPQGTGIPRLIHQTWQDTNVPNALAAYQQTWKQQHPNWSVMLWTDVANRELIRQKYAWFLPIYDAYPKAIMRADAARYFILHQFGGVYVDLDFEALRPLDPLLDGSQVILGLEPAEHVLSSHAVERDMQQIVCNAFMAAIPAHPFWQHLFKKLVDYSQSSCPLDAAGPFLLTRAYASYAENEHIALKPARLLYPINNTVPFKDLDPSEQRQIQEEAWAIHHWWGSWYREGYQTTTTITYKLEEQGQLRGWFLMTRDDCSAMLNAQEKLPLVSAMMVTKNRPVLAERAVNCFCNQTYSAKELVILDDGNDTRLELFVQGLNDQRLRFFRITQEDKTLGELRNLALARTYGEFVAQWDDDDFSDPQRLTIQMAALLKHQVDACLLQRHMIWYPQQQRLAISSIRRWESSFICRKKSLPLYQNLRKGEDTPVIEEIVTGRYVWLDFPQLYIYSFHGKNTWDAIHFEEFWTSATQRFEGSAYQKQLAELGDRLGMDLSIYPPIPLQDKESQEDTAPVPGDMSAVIATDRVELLGSILQQPANETTLPQVMILIPVKDAARDLSLCLSNLDALTFPHAQISLGFLESDSLDDTYQKLLKRLPDLQREFKEVTLLKRDYNYGMVGERWQIANQRRRREILARSRNFLLSRALQDEDWVLWIDADVVSYPADVIEQLLASNKTISVPNCLEMGTNRQFDLNTYRLKSAADTIDWEPYIIDGLLQPPTGLGRWYLNDLQLFDAVEVDAVGGTMLFVKADLHREGLVFPPFPYRLTIETEGLAAMAKDMGYRCWGLPKIVIHHSAR